jgi:transcriptional regulator with XRE-family HTH domain
VLAGVSQSFVSYVERARRRPDWPTACALAAAAGHELGLRLFPQAGPTLRDRGQVEAVEQIVASAHASWHALIEHPVGRADRRAADLVLRGAEEILHVEVERRLVDLQAQLRSAQLKRAALQEQFGAPVRLVVAVPGTRRARQLLADHKTALDRALPASSPRVWRAIRTGTPLGSDGILLLPPRHRSGDHPE